MYACSFCGTFVWGDDKNVIGTVSDAASQIIFGKSDEE
jgi:hypothetical protein